MRRWTSLAAITSLLIWNACSEESEPAPAAAPQRPAESAAPKTPAPSEPAAEPTPAPSEAELAERGRRVFMSNCIACHNADPTQAGAIGPAIAGSSEALLRAKVLRNEYPAGYTPKRDTQAMIPLPHLEPEIPALAAYLAQAADGD